MMRILILLTLIITSATADNTDISRTNNKNYINDAYKSEIALNKDNPDILILPGLEANRATKELHIIAEATGLKDGETAEFFLIAENSGHDYEALAVSFALPSDIRKALIFIGMKPGRPVNYKKMQFWPKGERVKMSFQKALTPNSNPIPAERLVMNTKTGKTIIESGFIFTGSAEVTSATNSSVKALAADVIEPMSIVANYNDPGSVFDLPRLVKQSEVYESQVISKNYSFKSGELLDIFIEPEYKDGRIRIYDLKLDVGWVPATTNSDASLLFNLNNKKKVLLSKATLPQLLEEFKKIINSGKDPFVTIDFVDNLPIQAANKICSILSSIDSESGIRIEAPTKGELYYKSFIPETYLRERKNRVPLKWEIHLKTVDGKVKCNLINIDPEWKDGKTEPTLKITNHDIQDSSELIKLLKSKEIGIPVLLVFAESDITYKQLMEIITPTMPIYNVIHIFVEKYLSSAVR